MPTPKDRILTENRRARYDYEILDTLEAGIELLGYEVKSAKAGRCHLTGSFVHIRPSSRNATNGHRGGEAWLTNAFIAPYAKASNLGDYDPERARRLLLRRADLNRLIGKQQAERLTIIPLRLTVAHGLVKVTIAVARGKKRYEKREAIRRREADRHIRAARKR